ncbi:hypothetical protein [Streptomyces sp. NPDC048282]|uniref:hypothetical protein n=1 Tax=Streptomyces sp. NPDC048282 TaxID=3365528 RepID=UPI0037214210
MTSDTSGTLGTPGTPDWLTALPAAGSAALVHAAATDLWPVIRDRFVLLLGRDAPDRATAAARRLDALRRIAAQPGSERELADARRDWRVRLQDLLEENPDTVHELRSVIAAVPPPRPTTTAAAYRQDNHAYDRSTLNAVQNGNLTIHRSAPDAPDG